MWENAICSHISLKTRGFSLYELLIAMAVLLILVAVTLNSMSDYARTQQHTRLVEEIGHQIHLARQQTLASKADSTYGIYVGTSTIEVFAGASPVVGSSANTILDLSAVTQTATSSFSDGNWYVVFERITGAASATGTITVTDTVLERTATYTIHSSGLIE